MQYAEHCNCLPLKSRVDYLDLTHITLFPGYSQLRAAVNQYFKNERSQEFRPRLQISRYFLIHNFFFPDTAAIHTFPAYPDIVNPLSRVKKNKSATNPITCGRVNFCIRKEKVADLKLRSVDRALKKMTKFASCIREEVFQITKPLKGNGKAALFSVSKLFKATMEPRFNGGPIRALAKYIRYNEVLPPRRCIEFLFVHFSK